MKKKAVGVIVGGILMSSVLLGCESEPVSKQKSEVEVVEEVGTTDVSADKMDVAEYATAISGYTSSLSDQMMTLSDLSNQLASNPLAVRDSDWVQEFAITMVLMEQNIKSIREIDPPAVVQEVHDLTLKAMDEYEFVVNNLPDAIDNMDVALIGQCSEAMERGTGYIVEATALTEEISADLY